MSSGRYTVTGGKPRVYSDKTPGTPRITPRLREFADVYLECGNATEALRRVYSPKTSNNLTIRRRAQTCLRRPSVIAYLAERQAEIAERHNVTVDSVNNEITEAIGLAREERNPSAMVSALTLRARLHGLLVDKREHAGPGGGPVQHEHRMSPEQVDAIMDATRDERSR